MFSAGFSDAIASRPFRGVRGSLAAVVLSAISLVALGCGGSGHGSSHAGAAQTSKLQLAITPVNGTVDTSPNRGIRVTAVGGTMQSVVVREGGNPVAGKLNAAGTVWRSTWALGVSRQYNVVATATAASGSTASETSTFRTFTPAHTFTAQITEGGGQTYGVGMPIILYFSQPVLNTASVERAMQLKTSKPVVGSWYWDNQCGMAPMCLYFRPRHYWPAHTHVSFTGHLDGVQIAPGVYGNHTLTQSFNIGSSLIVVASAASHFMNVYRDGKLFAHWPISSGRPGDDTPDGNYLTIEKENPADMVGPGYNIEVPYSVRFTWSGDYLHDAYWSVGEQGFTNVSHGCVNMPPADAATYYNMAVPGDPVKITGSPRLGGWDSGWTMWFLNWKQWLRGSALHKAMRVNSHGSTFISA